MYFIGHTNPDTDAICSAIGAANFMGGTPLRAGELNKETEFVLNYFNIPVPEMADDLTDKDLYIVDHNQANQAPEGWDNANIKCIIDHHPIQSSPITTDMPIMIYMMPWGSTSTIVANKYIEKGKEMSKEVAGALLAGLLSDTLALQSPTTTNKDKEILEHLMPIAGIEDYKAFAKEMFKAKSNISNLPTSEILNLDYKTFEFGDKKVGFGVAETVEPEVLLERKEEFVTAMNAQKENDKLDYIFFAVVDVLNSHSDLIIAGEPEKTLAEKVFTGSTENSTLDLGSRLSRKKEMIPPLSEVLS